MEERTAKLRERNRKRRGQKKGLNLKFAVDFLYLAAIILIIIGFSLPLELMFLIAGCAMLLGTLYYAYNCYKTLKSSPKKSPEYKDAVAASVFFGIMALISIIAIVFAIVEL